MGGMATMMEIRRGSKGVWLAAAVVGLGIAAVGVWLVAFDTPGTSRTNEDGGRVVALPLEPPTRSGAPLPPEPVPAVPTSSLAELAPADVMGNPDCTMRSGAGHGRDMAVVLVPAEDGLRFAVVDGTGIVFGDTLPFHSVRHSSLARRPDGSVLAGFGGADPPSSDGRGWQVASPRFGPRVDGVFVYQDGRAIYENRAASRFDVADDGVVLLCDRVHGRGHVSTRHPKPRLRGRELPRACQPAADQRRQRRNRALFGRPIRSGRTAVRFVFP